MPVEIIIALISAATSLFGSVCTIIVVVISNKSANAKQQQQFEISQAVMRKDIEVLTREVREQNALAHIIPSLEEKIKALEQKISIYHKGGAP